jgi:hypothetical protein
MKKKSKIQNPKSKILIVVACLLTLLLAACGELTPSGEVDQLLINEVYTGANNGGIQWIELLNNTNDMLSLAGYKLETSHGSVDLGALTSITTYSKLTKGSVLVITNSPQAINDQAYKFLQDSARDDNARAAVKRPPLPLKEDKVLGKLDPNKELVVLKGPDGKVIDQLGWGGPNLNSVAGLANDTNTNLPAPTNDNKSLGRTSTVGQDPGQLNPGPFTVHNTLTPGFVNIPRAPTTWNFIFTNFTDIVGTVGGAVLWLAFIIVALVAQRFETLSEQHTYWRWLMAAPAGILLYVILQVQDFIRVGRLEDFWSWPAFLSLFISGLACVYVINIFRLIAKNILESE